MEAPALDRKALAEVMAIRMRSSGLRRTIWLGLLLFPVACHSPNRAEAPPICASPPDVDASYQSTLRGGLTPTPLEWSGRSWRVNAGSITHRNMDHALRLSPGGNKIRFHLRDTPNDNSRSDSDGVRRAELSGSLFGDPERLPNGKPLWGAFTFIHHAWTDSDGMRELQGGVYGQIHVGSRFGGSPALAFRRRPDGSLRITTRGQNDPEGTVRYEGDVSFGEVHDAVFEVTLDPVDGSLRVWIDGQAVVDANHISIGHDNAESYWNIGLYFSGGITGPVIADYANHVYPASSSLADRIASAPCWPAN